MDDLETWRFKLWLYVLHVHTKGRKSGTYGYPSQWQDCTELRNLPCPEDLWPDIIFVYPQLWKQMEASQSFGRLRGCPVGDGIHKNSGQGGRRAWHLNQLNIECEGDRKSVKAPCSLSPRRGPHCRSGPVSSALSDLISFPAEKRKWCYFKETLVLLPLAVRLLKWWTPRN